MKFTLKFIFCFDFAKQVMCVLSFLAPTGAQEEVISDLRPCVCLSVCVYSMQ